MASSIANRKAYHSAAAKIHDGVKLAESEHCCES
jgi:hypothetical protein